MSNTVSHSTIVRSLPSQPEHAHNAKKPLPVKFFRSSTESSVSNRIAFFERKATEHKTGTNQLTRTAPRAITQSEEKPKASTPCDNRSTMNAIHKLSKELLEEKETSEQRKTQIDQLEKHVDALRPDNTEPESFSALISKNLRVITLCQDRLKKLKESSPKATKFHERLIKEREQENLGLSIAIAINKIAKNNNIKEEMPGDQEKAIHKLAKELLEEIKTSEQHKTQIDQMEKHVGALRPDNTEPESFSALISKNKRVITLCKDRLKKLEKLKKSSPKATKILTESIEKRQTENKDLSIAIDKIAQNNNIKEEMPGNQN